MRKHILLLIALCLHIAARGQTMAVLDSLGLPHPTTAKQIRYWFDDDAGSVQTVNGTSGIYSLDVNSMLDGLHTIHYQVIDNSDAVAYVSSGVFLKIAANAQSESVRSLRYWFDDDASSVQTVNGTSGIYSLDVSSMLEGMHTIHYQVVDINNDVAYISSGVFLKIAANAQSASARSLRYWFDDDAGSVQTVNGTSGIYSLNVSSMLEGLHTIHYQVVDINNDVAYVSSGIFLKIGSNTESETITAKRLLYWFDDETTLQYVDVTSGMQMLDASELMEGLHTLHYQVLFSNGQMTPAMSSIFLRISIDTSTTVAKSLRYWFDDEQIATEVEITEGVQILDASRLIEGLHTVHYQIVNGNGTLGAPYSSVFLKMDADTAAPAKSIRYWFDDDASTVKMTDVANGTQTLDVSALLMGPHTLNYQLIDSNGKVSVPVTRFFFKNFDKVLADGTNRVTKYQYWLNTNNQSIQTVELENVSNPYTLIALLPMQKEPIQSSQFHFEVTDDVPTIYAKNTFHVRFWDAQGYFSNGEKPFVDYSVKQEVEPVGELQTSQSFNKIVNNAIRWYTLQAAPGDTVAFKLSQAATVQLFAPGGAEVFKTSESASMKWNGIHVWENGTYYLAVHDVTGSQSTMKLEYMHMDKYDVVDWDVHRVGNGGCSTITFKGNGFRDLYTVDLVIAPGDTIHSVDVSHDSDAETAVIFDFTDATLGDYNAVFHFTEEDKPVANVVTVEEAVDIELATNITYPSTFLRGTSTTYSINIKNYGNMTAYSIPIYVYISSATLNGISNIKVKGLKLKGLYDYIENKDSIDERTLMEIRNLCDNMGEDHYFNKIATTDEQSGDSIIVRSGFFTVDLPPNTIKTVTVEIRSTEMIDAWFTIPDEWHNIILNEGMDVNNRRKESATDWLCCYHERLECLGTIVVNVSDVVGMLPIPQAKVATVVSCVTGIINQTIKSSASVLCNKENVRKNFYDKVKSIADGISITGTVLTCASKFVKGNQLKELLSSISLSGDALTHPTATVDCITAWSKKKPNCPPKPPKGGKSTPQPPGDPNDIYGYLSEAGSKFIADSVAMVNYTIEFENDTTFAEAAAHTIVIKDTLDNRYFDLTKFMPTGVRIGGHDVFLNEADIVTNNDKTSFVKTIDMRPEINAIAQVNGEYNQKNGIAQWTFQSLDPMTMEPTDDLMQGILPVNYDGTSGIGEVMFEIGVKQGKADGTQLSNRAGIVFDYEEAILTPTWTNIVDAVAPSSVINDSWMANDSTLRITADGFDARSGVWKYEWYVQAGENAPWWKEGETGSASFDYHIYEGIDYGFCVLAVDSAGNVEQKVIQRERGFKTYGPDYEDNISPVLTSPEVEGPVYDLSGRKHDEPQENQINIIDKKKILFRRKGK